MRIYTSFGNLRTDYGNSYGLCFSVFTKIGPPSTHAPSSREQLHMRHVRCRHPRSRDAERTSRIGSSRLGSRHGPLRPALPQTPPNCLQLAAPQPTASRSVPNTRRCATLALYKRQPPFAAAFSDCTQLYGIGPLSQRSTREPLVSHPHPWSLSTRHLIARRRPQPRHTGWRTRKGF